MKASSFRRQQKLSGGRRISAARGVNRNPRGLARQAMVPEDRACKARAFLTALIFSGYSKAFASRKGGSAAYGRGYYTIFLYALLRVEKPN